MTYVSSGTLNPTNTVLFTHLCVFLVFASVVTLILVLCPARGAEYRDQFVCVSVHLSVYVSVCRRAYFLNRWTDLHKILCADLLWPWLGPSLATLQYVMYFRFYGSRHIWLQWAVWQCVASGVAIPAQSLMSMNALL